MHPGVKSVTATDEHRLIIGFGNGERRIFDVTPLLPIGRFRELAARQAFKTVHVAFDTIEWDNGLDLDPEYLYDHSETLSCEHAAAVDHERRGSAKS